MSSVPQSPIIPGLHLGHTILNWLRVDRQKRNSASGERWTVANQQLELAELAAASALAQFAAEPEPEPAAEHTHNAVARGDNEAAWLKYVRGDNK